MDMKRDAEANEPKAPALAKLLEEGFKHTYNANRTANTFPIDQSYDMFKTYVDFNSVMSKIRNNINDLCSQIVAVELPSVTLHSDETSNDSNTDKVVDANDSCLDRVNIYIDLRSGVQTQPSVGVLQVTKRAQPGPLSAAAAASSLLITTEEMDKRELRRDFVRALYAPRPQLRFSDAVDNSYTPGSLRIFKPRITVKPNAIEPLQLTLIYDNENRPIRYEHPYSAELMEYKPPEWALQGRVAPARPPPLHATPLTLVDTQPHLDTLLAHLDTVTEFAVDLENHSQFSYQGFTCVIQISTDEGGDFIVDAIALRDSLHALNTPFTDPTKIKVFHGADMDVQWLQRDFGVYIVGLFDTHQAAIVLRHNRKGLVHVVKKYCDIDLDKKFQEADWRVRPLPSEMVQYARCDTHYLLYTYRRMCQDLLQLDVYGKTLSSVFDKSVRVALKTYVMPQLFAQSHVAPLERIYFRGSGAQHTAARALFAWRDARARDLDVAPHTLLSKMMLARVATLLPRDMPALKDALRPSVLPYLQCKADAEMVLAVIRECCDVNEEPATLDAVEGLLSLVPTQLPERPRRPRRRNPRRNISQRETRYPHDYAYGPPSSLDAPSFEELQRYREEAEREYQLAVEAEASSANPAARTFLPPYDRYRMYRLVAQLEELRARLAAAAVRPTCTYAAAASGYSTTEAAAAAAAAAAGARRSETEAAAVARPATERLTAASVPPKARTQPQKNVKNKQNKRSKKSRKN